MVVYLSFSITCIFNLTVVVDLLKLTLLCDFFVGVSLTGSNAIFFFGGGGGGGGGGAEKRQTLLSLLISILQNRWLLPQ